MKRKPLAVTVPVRVSQAERKRWQKAARDASLTLSAWVRMVCFRASLVIKTEEGR